ncbi:DUF2946 domain-containing protein [Rosenbergiella australiborealis]|uniref:DUF2946 domain-containing protein n=1 Tax=Rosenbergiella australiborealis TaxID=1544696 RepID=A0ABS5T559_9GAMM|nr:DUF2946 domain-containing protein [Rosenbergiella australiborealis]MBT0727476.1 DUF2946 domain-containing protein [Rosenbergiella australiborealis]
MLVHSVKNRLIATLALLSMLLLFIAPLVSLALFLSHSDRVPYTSQSCPLSMNDGAMSEEMMHHMTPQKKGEHSSVESGLLCGYCELLIHFPFLVSLAAAILWFITALSRVTPRIPYQTIILIPFYPPQLSRGPPSVGC